MMTFEQLGLNAGEILLPAENFEKWAVVACDQYTSEPEYWQKTEEITRGFPSALNLMLPEVYLNAPDADKRIEQIKRTMGEYVQSGVLVKLPRGAIFTRRTAQGKTRRGAIFALDLERYDYSADSMSLIRATEGTIAERIPPRLRIREGAPLEMPHVMVLIDDKTDSFISAVEKAANKPLYDFELMQSGGHIAGMFAPEEALEPARAALEKLYSKAVVDQGKSPMLFAVGDGNHSLATAKAAWEKLKAAGAAMTHPARFALAEIVNIHDEGLIFEPIHRALFNAAPNALSELLGNMRLTCSNVLLDAEDDRMRLPKAEQPLEGIKTHTIICVLPGCDRVMTVEQPERTLEVSTLQTALDIYLSVHHDARVDYIHGEDSVRAIVRREKAIGFLLPPVAKQDFFHAVITQGALERKTFSIGNANEKRYYIECRKIQI